jgi:hypothetical protein
VPEKLNILDDLLLKALMTFEERYRHPCPRRVTNQEQHHRKKSFREELLEMLGKTRVEYDPKCLD